MNLDMTGVSYRKKPEPEKNVWEVLNDLANDIYNVTQTTEEINQNTDAHIEKMRQVSNLVF